MPFGISAAFDGFSLLFLLPLRALVPLVRVVAAVEGEVDLAPLANVAGVGLPGQGLQLAVLEKGTPEWQFICVSSSVPKL